MPLKNKKSSKRYRKTQKLWKMRGCAASRRRRMGNKLVRRMIGGSPITGCSTCQVGGTVPSALNGSPWTSNPNSWGVTNYFANNTYKGLDPQTQGVISERTGQIYNGKGGGRGSRYNQHKSNRNKRGGGINLGSGGGLGNIASSIKFGAGSTYNALKGFPPPMNPSPTFQPSLM